MKDDAILLDAGTPRRVREACVLSALVAYSGWWSYWLLQGRFPPAPLLWMTGCPAPTTGCIRSLVAMMQGRLAESFLWNPFAIPLAVLFVVSIVWVVLLLARGSRVRLPQSLFAMWALILTGAWVAKFVIGAQYW